MNDNTRRSHHDQREHMSLPHVHASHHVSPHESGEEESASTEAIATQEIVELSSNVDPLPPAFGECTRISPPQAPPVPTLNSIIDGVREGHCLSGAESVPAPVTLTRAQNYTQQLGDERLSNDPITPSLVSTPPDNTYAHIIETDFCDWMREQREVLASSQENLPRVQINSAGSVNSHAPMHDDHPSEEELCALGLPSQSLLGMGLTWEAERAMHQSGIQIDNSAPISNPDIADVLHYLEQNPSQDMLETLAAASSGMATAHGMAMGEENGGAAAAEIRQQLMSTRLMAIPEQAPPEYFVLSAGESDTETLTDISSGESKQSSRNSMAEERTEPNTSISMWQRHSTLHSSASGLEVPESDSSDSGNGDEVSWRSMRHEMKRQIEESNVTFTTTEADECLGENPIDARRQQEQSSLRCCEEMLELFESGRNKNANLADISSNNEAAATISVSSQTKPSQQPKSYEDKDEVEVKNET